MKCYNCKHECGEWISFERYLYACELDLDCPVEDNEKCEKFEECEG